MRPQSFERGQIKAGRLQRRNRCASTDDAVTSVVSAFTGLSQDRVVEEKAADLTPVRSDAIPLLKVTRQRQRQQSQKLLIGDETPTGGSFYAKARRRSRVFTFSGTKSSLDKSCRRTSATSGCSHSMTRKLTRVALTAKGSDGRVRTRTSNNEWQILKPRPLRADNWASRGTGPQAQGRARWTPRSAMTTRSSRGRQVRRRHARRGRRT